MLILHNFNAKIFVLDILLSTLLLLLAYLELHKSKCMLGIQKI